MKVYFLDTVHPILAQRLAAAGHQCVDATQLTYEECCVALNDAEGIVIRSRFPMNESLLKHAPQLKFIARSGAGMENIDEAYTSARGIICYNAPEGNRNAVGEHALGMLLSLFNNLNKGDREVRKGIWDREGNRGVELDGKTVGIIGYGNNGSAFAKKLRGFDVDVLAYDKYVSGFGNDFVKEVTLQEIFDQSDVVSFHIPQNDETRFMGNADFFHAFKKPIYIINLSRGKIIRTTDLVNAIQNGKVLGACLDVLEYESSSFEKIFDDTIPDALNYLVHSDKVILSPHVGGWTVESYFKLSDVLADKILKGW
jgi:D-3-phosphoglycerate dehydrogenase / 2-oxoglutarate reductase